MKERMLSSRSENEGRRGRSVGSQVGNKGRAERSRRGHRVIRNRLSRGGTQDRLGGLEALGDGLRHPGAAVMAWSRSCLHGLLYGRPFPTLATVS